MDTARGVVARLERAVHPLPDRRAVRREVRPRGFRPRLVGARRLALLLLERVCTERHRAADHQGEHDPRFRFDGDRQAHRALEPRVDWREHDGRSGEEQPATEQVGGQQTEAREPENDADEPPRRVPGRFSRPRSDGRRCRGQVLRPDHVRGIVRRAGGWTWNAAMRAGRGLGADGTAALAAGLERHTRPPGGRRGAGDPALMC